MLLNLAVLCFVLVAPLADATDEFSNVWKETEDGSEITHSIGDATQAEAADESTQEVEDAPKPEEGDEISQLVQNAFLAEHNVLREAVGVSSLTWNQTLSEFAASWGASCSFEHSQGPYGENLFTTSSPTSDQVVIAQDSVKAWAAEIASVDLPDWTCLGSSCGHYSQVVWGKTEMVGCAITHCDITTDSPWYYVVCEYSPSGNWIGEVPY